MSNKTTAKQFKSYKSYKESTDEIIETNVYENNADHDHDHDKLHDINDEKDTNSPFAFIALILITTLFLSAIIFQSNNSTKTNNTNIVASQHKLNHGKKKNWPIVISTWNFMDAVEIAYDTLIKTNDSLESIVSGCSYCEYNPYDCGWSVGYGAKPDTAGEVTLDSLIMYGPTHSAGGVGQLRNIKNAIGVARAVMLHTTHTLLVGESATAFAKMMGFKPESLASVRSKKIHKIWQNNHCQPNSYMNLPDVNISCPPYEHTSSDGYNSNYNYDNDNNEKGWNWNQFGHDTIGMISIDKTGAMSVGTSTNGLRYKVHGRVGDSAIVGHGAYVKQGVGGSVATGNGDIMMLYAPTRIAVYNMQNGMGVRKACDHALQQIVDGYNTFEGALLCMDAKGNFAAAKYMNRPFHYVYKDKYVESAKLLQIS